MIELKKIERLIRKYAFEQLEKGEHPDDVEFELIDVISQSVDEFGTDGQGNRVDFEDSDYYHERHKGGVKCHYQKDSQR